MLFLCGCNRANAENWNLYIFIPSQKPVPEDQPAPTIAVPPTCCGCSSDYTKARAAILYFGRHRDKPGVGYTCSLQAMSCVSRASPTSPLQRKIKKASATRAAPQCSRVPHSSNKGGGPGESSTYALTFTCHFRLRRTPHWGAVARECPRRLCATRFDVPSSNKTTSLPQMKTAAVFPHAAAVQ